jgi:uncharacterized protein (TIGR02147 family)
MYRQFYLLSPSSMMFTSNMKNFEVYRSDDPLEIFLKVFNEKNDRNPQFSIRAWSKKLGFRNPSHVADVLNGRRNLTVEFGLRVSDALDLTPEEKVYFESLVFLSNAKKPSEKIYFTNVVRKLKQDCGTKAIEPDSHGIIRDWYYGVLDEMTCLADFTPDPQYIAKRLGDDVTPQAVAAALVDLIRLGSIERGPKGKLIRPRKVFFRTKELDDQPEDLSIRKYQRRFLEKSLVAMDEQTQGESVFRMTNIPIKLRQFKDFKMKIDELVQTLVKLESSKDADEVFHLGIQFCRITQKHQR